MKKINFLLVVFLVINTQLFSQIIRKISWSKLPIHEKLIPPDGNESDVDGFKYLYFDKAVILEEESFIPKYIESFYIDEGGNYYFLFADLQFEVLPAEILQGIDLGENINSEIQFQQKIINQKGKAKLEIQFVPIRKNPATNQYEKLVSFTLTPDFSRKITVSQKIPKKRAITSSVLSSGKWFKIKTDKGGVYKISNSQLESWGIDPSQVNVYGNNFGQLPFVNNHNRPDDLLKCKISKTNDGILFYAKEPEMWQYNKNEGMYLPKKHLYSNYQYFFLSSDNNDGLNSDIPFYEQPAEAANYSQNTFIDYSKYEKDLDNILNSGNMWVGEPLDMEPDIAIDKFLFPNFIPSSNCTIKTSLVNRSRNPDKGYFEISSGSFIDTVAINGVPFVYGQQYAEINVSKFNFVSNVVPTINIRYWSNSQAAEAWLDYVIVNAKRELKMTGDQMNFRQVDSSNQVIEFVISNASNSLRVWDISDPVNVKELQLNISGETATFKYRGTGVHEFIAFNGSSFLPVISDADDIGEVVNQNLHGLSPANLVIVTHPDFLAQAEEVAQIHRDVDHLSVLVITTEQVYNEFSCGALDASAIRDFMKMLHDKAMTDAEKPNYLLLFGDGSYDHKGIEAKENNTNFIPVYQSDNSINPAGSYVSDDFFSWLEDGEIGATAKMKVGVGRFPVVNLQEADVMVNKLKAYYNVASLGDWRNNICFVADDGDRNDHFNNSESIANKVSQLDSRINVDKIYMAAFNQIRVATGELCPDMNQSITSKLRKGTLIMNYTGHGGVNGLGHENIITKNDINSWDNINKLTIFVTATCEFSRFDDYALSTAGEQVLLNPDGAAIALFTTTRIVYSAPNYTLNNALYDYVFLENIDGHPVRLGDICRSAKNSIGTSTNKLNFSLLGDPAIRIPLASGNNKMALKSMNDDHSPSGDTIQALGKYELTLEVQDKNNQKISDFNGIGYLTIFDKEKTKKTMEIDSDNSAQTFVIQNSMIYKGKSSITNGECKFSFVVPKDIDYSIAKSKLSFYFHSGMNDFASFDSTIMVGGESKNPVKDQTGPEIELFLNDKNFVFGGITNESPVIIANVTDSSGVNTLGAGIGHDILAMIDDDRKNSFVLNDAYLPELDNYKKGKIEYRMPDQTEGPHNLKLNIWDVANNSSEDYIEFVVAESSELLIKHLFNYPNPFTQNTYFYYEHNQPRTEHEILIQIYTVSGKIVKTIEGNNFSAGFLSEPVFWDGLDDYGDRIGKGVYIYKIRVKTENGNVTEKYEKLLLLK